MEWFTSLLPSLNNLPWWVWATVLATLGVSREIIPAIIRWRGQSLEERKYEDGEAKAARNELVDELKQQVKSLCSEVTELTKKCEAADAAHVKCQLDMAELRGDMKVMQKEIEALKRHEQNNLDNTKKLAEIVKEETGKAPTIV